MGVPAWCRLTMRWGRDASLFRKASGWLHKWLVKSAWSSQVKGQPGADTLPVQAEPAQVRVEEGRTGAASSSEGLGQQRVRDALSVSQETFRA